MMEWRRSVTTNDDKVDFLKPRRFNHILKYLFVKAIWEDNLYDDYVYDYHELYCFFLWKLLYFAIIVQCPCKGARTCGRDA